jgi:ribosome-binding protein aMBF1 (putative translation factor)
MECFKCGVSGEKSRLFDAISEDGIVKICEGCSINEKIPFLRKSFLPKSEEVRKESTVYERVSRISSVEKKEQKNINFSQDVTLRDIVDKNFKREILPKSKPKIDLINNFHWVIMRARRFKKITVEQLANEIGVSSLAIKMAEQASLPENYLDFISKLEIYLGVKLLKDEFRVKKIISKPLEFSNEESKKYDGEIDESLELKFDPILDKNLNISDLQKMKQEEESKIFEKPVEQKGEEIYLGSEIFSDDEPEFTLEQAEEKKLEKELRDEKIQEIKKTNFAKKNNLSDKDINDIIFKGGSF